MSTTSDWMKNHKSANFFWLIILIGIILLAIGLFLGQGKSPALSFISTIVIQLSGAALATAILTVFLSFGDIRKTLSNTLTDLWIEGKVVDSLSSKVKSQIDKRIILSSKENIIESIDEALYKSLTEQRINSLNNFYLHNFSYEIDLNNYEQDSNFIIHSVKSSYRVYSSHLLDNKRKFPLKYYYEISVPKEASLSKEEFLRRFHIRVDEFEFNEGDVNFERKSIGTLDAIAISFDKCFEVKDCSDVLIDIETLSCKNINDEVLIARYPTNGYKVTLRYSADYEYDSCWFVSNKKKDMTNYNSEQQITHHDGISVMTNDWVLPGDGVTLCWYNKTTLPDHFETSKK